MGKILDDLFGEYQAILQEQAMEEMYEHELKSGRIKCDDFMNFEVECSTKKRPFQDEVEVYKITNKSGIEYNKEFILNRFCLGFLSTRRSLKGAFDANNPYYEFEQLNKREFMFKIIHPNLD